MSARTASTSADTDSPKAWKSAPAAEADQTRARIEAVRRLNADAPAARAALERCRRKTPDLN